MFVIGPQAGSLAMMENIPDFDMKEIASIYKKMENEQTKRFRAAQEKTKKYIAELFAARAKAAPEQDQNNPLENKPT
jgi:Leu/Phe-tRNA-protein transferase